MERQRSKVLVALILLASQLIFIAPATATSCAVTYGTVSGTTRYAKIISGSSCLWSIPVGVTSISYLVAAGGGGGGGARTTVAPNLGGGGGGAGGTVETGTISVATGNSISLTVGTGGSGGSVGSAGTAGLNSTLTYNATNITAYGGDGGGGANGANDQNNLAGDGGANTNFSGGLNVWDGGGGGAGAISKGSDGTDIASQGGIGGAGGLAASSTLLGSTKYYGGGGGGGGTPSTNSNETDGAGGIGGNSVGGNGGGGAGNLAVAGSANTGSGGGGGGWRFTNTDAQRAGAAGADGIIIFVYTKNPSSIINVTSSNADGEYVNGDVLTFLVTFNESVTVTGTPTLPLETGNSDANASYLSGSGTPTLTFTYTVAAGQASADLATKSAASLSLVSSSVTSLDGFAASVFINYYLAGSAGSLAYNKNLSFNTTKVVNVTSTTANGNYTTGQVINIQVEFTGPISQIFCGGNVALHSHANYSENSTYSSGVGSKFLNFNYTVLSNDSIADLDYWSTGSLKPAGCQLIYDALGAEIIYTLPTPGTLGSLGYNKDISLNLPSSSISLEFSGGATTGIFRTTTSIIATTSIAGKVKFYANGKAIANCSAVTTISLVANCSWKPSQRGITRISARLKPTSTSYASSLSPEISIAITNRSTKR